MKYKKVATSSDRELRFQQKSPALPSILIHIYEHSLKAYKQTIKSKVQPKTRQLSIPLAKQPHPSTLYILYTQRTHLYRSANTRRQQIYSNCYRFIACSVVE